MTIGLLAALSHGELAKNGPAQLNVLKDIFTYNYDFKPGGFRKNARPSKAGSKD